MVKTHSACTVECSELDIRFSFDVGRSMFDVGRSSFSKRSRPYCHFDRIVISTEGRNLKCP